MLASLNSQKNAGLEQNGKEGGSCYLESARPSFLRRWRMEEVAQLGRQNRAGDDLCTLPRGRGQTLVTPPSVPTVLYQVLRDSEGRAVGGQ